MTTEKVTEPRDIPEDDLIGQVLQDTYRITRPIAEGGMGVVYEASHVRLSKKRYAVKVLISSIMHMPNVYARFQREAEIASELGHPNIVDVQDSNLTEDGRAYIVMEYLEGQDMGARLEEGPMTPREVSLVIRQVASALQAAHDNGVVHRDMKPANIFLVNSPDNEMRVKVLDFGISKITHSKSIVTAEQSLLGTVYYMSPEQAEGCIPDIDHLTDIFALGTICYQALSGLLPFNAPTMPGVIYQICHRQQEPFTELMPELPPAVDNVLARALAKEKADRYQRVEEFARDLDRALAGKTEVTPSPPPPERERITAVDLLPRGQPEEKQVDQETQVRPVDQLELEPAAAGTGYLPLDEAFHGGAGAEQPPMEGPPPRAEEEGPPAPGRPAKQDLGQTNVVPVEEIFTRPPTTGPEAPAQAAVRPPTTGPEAPAQAAVRPPTTGPEAPAQAVARYPTTGPEAPALAAAQGPPPSVHTTMSGAAGQTGEQRVPRRKHRLGRWLGLPLLILFWVGLAVGIFMLASGPPEGVDRQVPAAAGPEPQEEETALGSTEENEPGPRVAVPARADSEVSARAGADAGEPATEVSPASLAGRAPDKETAPDAGAAPGAPSVASVKHRKNVKRPARPRKKPRRPRRRRPPKKKKQPIVGFDKL